MNKLTKGIIVGGVGLVLVLGGTASLALWNGSANVNAGTVKSGVMTISAVDGTWSDDITLWVPGDTATYTTNLTLTLSGDNLTTELALDATSITGSAPLLEALDIDLSIGTITGGGTATAVSGKTNTFKVTSDTPAESTALTVPVTVTVDFPETSVTGTTGQGESVDLNTIAFTLTQLAPSP